MVALAGRMEMETEGSEERWNPRRESVPGNSSRAKNEFVCLRKTRRHWGWNTVCDGNDGKREGWRDRWEVGLCEYSKESRF